MKYSKKTHKRSHDPIWAADATWFCSHNECEDEWEGTAERPVHLLDRIDGSDDNEGTCQRHATKALWKALTK